MDELIQKFDAVEDVANRDAFNIHKTIAKAQEKRIPRSTLADSVKRPLETFYLYTLSPIDLARQIAVHTLCNDH